MFQNREILVQIEKFSEILLISDQFQGLNSAYFRPVGAEAPLLQRGVWAGIREIQLVTLLEVRRDAADPRIGRGPRCAGTWPLPRYTRNLVKSEAFPFKARAGSEACAFLVDLAVPW